MASDLSTVVVPPKRVVTDYPVRIVPLRLSAHC